jgi:hypothetical protein
MTAVKGITRAALAAANSASAEHHLSTGPAPTTASRKDRRALALD